MPTSGDTGAGFSSTARHQVEQILSRPPYRNSDRTPRPLAGILHALGRALDAVFGPPLRWLYHHVLLHIGHGFTESVGAWWPLAVAALAVVAGVLAGVVLVRHRTRVQAPAVASRGHLSAEDPGALEAEASAAETAGDHERAVRLRYRAGLIRLARQGALVDDGARTDRQLAQLVGSATFGRLARRHERIVYGGEPAVAEDSSTARHEWPRVLVEARGGGTGP